MGVDKTSAPLLKFPFLSILVTGKHTEIVLSRGSHLHTVMGMTTDLALGNVIDRLAKQVSELLNSKLQSNTLAQEISYFMSTHNSKYENRLN